MCRLRMPVSLLCLLLASCTAIQDAVDKHDADKNAHDPNPTTADDVKFIRDNRKECREMKCGTCRAGHRELIYGLLSAKRLIAAAEVMLANPECDEEIEDAFSMISRAKGDRSRFIQPAVRALGHADLGVRLSAVGLLGEIGSRNEGPALVAMLSNELFCVAPAAVKSLAAIGGPNELIALDAWILRVGPDLSPGRLEVCKQQRDAFAARLVKEGQLPPKNENP